MTMELDNLRNDCARRQKKGPHCINMNYPEDWK